MIVRLLGSVEGPSDDEAGATWTRGDGKVGSPRSAAIALNLKKLNKLLFRATCRYD